jgi:serine/threonine protein phosphatase PrpC
MKSLSLKTEKTVLVGKAPSYVFCSGEMQGWRPQMEDKTITCTDMGDGNSLFAIFDGHGGK